jgi:hypothetical protein
LLLPPERLSWTTDTHIWLFGWAIDEIIRPDWSEKPRDEQGRFLTKSDAELRQQLGERGRLRV